MFKSGIADPVQGNKYMGIVFRFNAVQWHKEFKCIFVYQDLWKPTPTRKLSPNWKLYPFLKKNPLYIPLCLSDWTLPIC